MRPAALLLLACLPALAAVEDQLSSHDVEQRLAAIASIRARGHDRAEELLLGALKDDDWEVVHRAAEALGERGSARSVDALFKLALGGPVRRIRLAAAASLKRLDASGAADRLDKRLRGKTALVACDAAEVLARPETARSLERLAKNKDGAMRAAAVRALAALADAGRIKYFAEFLDDADIRVRAAAVRALARTRDRRAIAPLRDGFKDKSMPAVMERRHIAAIRDVLCSIEDAKQRDFAALMCARSAGSTGHAAGEARYARLFGSLGRKQAPVGPVAEYAKVLKSVGLAHADPSVRAAAVHSLARLGRDEDYARIAEVAKHDASERVRFHALRAAVAIRGDKAEPLVIDRLQYDESAMVREEAAVFCGRRRLARSAPMLVKALNDASWEVCTSAAVSLGKLHTPEGFAPLSELYEAKEWRRRGAAVVGLGWLRDKRAVPRLIDALRDKEPAVARTALEFLRHVTGEPLEPVVKRWREYWHRNERVFVFRDREAEAREKKKYGYAAQPRKVYEDLDVVVLQTRRGGDNIQKLLADYGIEHRIVRAASVAKIGLHPYALFVANCPGEITAKDVERLQWFVRAGGYLFASCWALTHTVQECFPGVVQKLETRAQVLDVVEAEPCPVHSPFIEGVFDGVTQPYYMLEGSHLIDVIDRERFQVLIDSPECATRWGDGDLAGWFTIGHGTVLDSANHFDLQGMLRARVRDEKERMAYALDHLGYDYAAWRKLKDEGVFRKQPLAVKRTRDVSIFRFITTFVRNKRLADEE